MTEPIVIATNLRTGKEERMTKDQADRLKAGMHGRLFRFEEIKIPEELAEPVQGKPAPRRSRNKSSL